MECSTLPPVRVWRHGEWKVARDWQPTCQERAIEEVRRPREGFGVFYGETDYQPVGPCKVG